MNDDNEVKDNEESTSEKVADNVAGKVKFEFPYSEIIRDKIPKAFNIAENVATQWKNNDKVENVGLSHPLAEIVAVKAFEKAKTIEKKLEEKGIFTMAQMGFEIAKAQALTILDKIKK